MVIQVNEKWMIKFDPELKQYIYFRVMVKSEIQAHLAEAEKQLSSVETAINTFSNYLNDERVVDIIKEVEP